MGVRPDNFNPAEDESESTLVTPRFDEEEARRAHPVVPLAEARPRAAFARPPARRARSVRRSWLPVLLVVALVAVATAAGRLAIGLIRRPQADTVTHDVPTAVAPVQAAEAPAQTEQPAAAAPREEPHPKPAPRPARNRRAEEAAALAAAEAARDYEGDSRGEDEGRRDRARAKRRERGEDGGENEMRRVLKDAAKDAAKKKVPRLIDVLTGPGQ